MKQLLLILFNNISINSCYIIICNNWNIYLLVYKKSTYFKLRIGQLQSDFEQVGEKAACGS